MNIADAALGHMSAGDIDHDECLMNDFSTSPQRFHRQFQEIVMQIEEEFSVIQQQEFKIQHKQATLLEVFCSPNSELTQQVRNQRKDAYRMSLDQADLSTQNGRQVLFKHVMMYNPRTYGSAPRVALGAHGVTSTPIDRLRALTWSSNSAKSCFTN